MRPRILFVDDEPLILSSLRRTFRKEQVDVETALHPWEALALLRTATFDVLISDYRMPELVGTDFLRAAREAGCCAITILLTGQSDTTVVRQALVDGTVNIVMHKPWRNSLKETILQACRVVSKVKRASAIEAAP